MLTANRKLILYELLETDHKYWFHLVMTLGWAYSQIQPEFIDMHNPSAIWYTNYRWKYEKINN